MDNCKDMLVKIIIILIIIYIWTVMFFVSFSELADNNASLFKLRSEKRLSRNDSIFVPEKTSQAVS